MTSQQNSPAILIGLALLAFFGAATLATAQEPENPLKPPDLSSPRAALKTFLDTGDALGAFIAQEYLPSPSRAEFQHLVSLGRSVTRCLDLSKVPPAARRKDGGAAAMALYETLNRIELPAFDAIPDAEQLTQPALTNTVRWVIPNTEIVLERVSSGPNTGEFLFSAETVADAKSFYERVRELPYTRTVPLKNLHNILMTHGGWMIPYAWIQALPAWMHIPWAGQPIWKWIALIVVLGIFWLLLRGVYRYSHKNFSRHPLRQALARSALPAFILMATPAVTYLSLLQINISGTVGSTIELTASAIMFLAGAWISWRVAPVLAEALIATPRINTESIDAHLIRICSRLFGIVGGACLLGIGAGRLGLPIYGVVAGLGVGGLAIALAAQSTVENLIGGLSLFADKPLQVGDLCQYGEKEGIVEGIGIRSTRIRGRDRTLTTIPNAELSKIPVVNLSQRDRMLIKSVIGVRYETSPEQLRFLLVKIREMLLGHSRVNPELLRVRFVGFGDSSLNIEIFAYTTTRDWTEFLGLQEDIFLRIMDIVEESGSGFAFPSRTLYFGRDGGLDAKQTEAAEAKVRQWREEGRLPFPNFSPEQLQKIEGTVPFPPSGSPDAKTPPSSE